MRKNIICVFLLIMGFKLLAQDIPYKLSFTINGEKQELNNNFTLYFVHIKDGEKIIYIPKTQNDTFYLSNILSEDEKPFEEWEFYYWIIEYKNIIYIIHYGKLLFFEDPVNMKIVFESVPFDKEKWKDDCPCNWNKNDNFKGAIRVSWTVPSIGMRTCKDIIDLKYYFKEGKELLSLPTHSKKSKCCIKSKQKTDNNPNGWGVWE